MKRVGMIKSEAADLDVERKRRRRIKGPVQSDKAWAAGPASVVMGWTQTAGPGAGASLGSGIGLSDSGASRQLCDYR